MASCSQASDQTTLPYSLTFSSASKQLLHLGSIIWSILFYNVSCGTPGFFRGVRNYRKGGGWGMQVDYTLDPYLEAISTFSFITLSNSGRKKLPLL